MEKKSEGNFFYTGDHDWLESKGTNVLMGVSDFKLTGFKVIKNILISAAEGAYKPQGTCLMQLHTLDYHIDLIMPFDGYLLHINPLILNEPDRLIRKTTFKDPCWIVELKPVILPDWRSFLLPEQYGQLNYI